jgi:hypothetical protein
MDHICPRAWRLGAGGTLTILRFAPLARLSPVPGFNAHFGACSWFKHTEVHFGEPVFNKVEGGKWKRPNFFIFWPIEVP